MQRTRYMLVIVITIILVISLSIITLVFLLPSWKKNIKTKGGYAPAWKVVSSLEPISIDRAIAEVISESEILSASSSDPSEFPLKKTIEVLEDEGWSNFILMNSYGDDLEKYERAFFAGRNKRKPPEMGPDKPPKTNPDKPPKTNTDKPPTEPEVVLDQTLENILAASLRYNKIPGVLHELLKRSITESDLDPLFYLEYLYSLKKGGRANVSYPNICEEVVGMKLVQLLPVLNSAGEDLFDGENENYIFEKFPETIHSELDKYHIALIIADPLFYISAFVAKKLGLVWGETRGGGVTFQKFFVATDPPSLDTSNPSFDFFTLIEAMNPVIHADPGTGSKFKEELKKCIRRTFVLLQKELAVNNPYVDFASFIGQLSRSNDNNRNKGISKMLSNLFCKNPNSFTLAETCVGRPPEAPSNPRHSENIEEGEGDDDPPSPRHSENIEEEEEGDDDPDGISKTLAGCIVRNIIEEFKCFLKKDCSVSTPLISLKFIRLVRKTVSDVLGFVAKQLAVEEVIDVEEWVEQKVSETMKSVGGSPKLSSLVPALLDPQTPPSAYTEDDVQEIGGKIISIFMDKLGEEITKFLHNICCSRSTNAFSIFVEENATELEESRAFCQLLDAEEYSPFEDQKNDILTYSGSLNMDSDHVERSMFADLKLNIRNWYSSADFKRRLTKMNVDRDGVIHTYGTGIEKGYEVADIYPAIKVEMMIVYMLAVFAYRDVRLPRLDIYIAVYLLYVQMFNSYCACYMGGTWNNSIKNEYVYISENVNGTDVQMHTLKELNSIYEEGRLLYSRFTSGDHKLTSSVLASTIKKVKKNIHAFYTHLDMLFTSIVLKNSDLLVDPSGIIARFKAMPYTRKNEYVFRLRDGFKDDAFPVPLKKGDGALSLSEFEEVRKGLGDLMCKGVEKYAGLIEEFRNRGFLDNSPCFATFESSAEVSSGEDGKWLPDNAKPCFYKTMHEGFLIYEAGYYVEGDDPNCYLKLDKDCEPESVPKESVRPTRLSKKFLTFFESNDSLIDFQKDILFYYWKFYIKEKRGVQYRIDEFQYYLGHCDQDPSVYFEKRVGKVMSESIGEYFDYRISGVFLVIVNFKKKDDVPIVSFQEVSLIDGTTCIIKEFGNTCFCGSKIMGVYIPKGVKRLGGSCFLSCSCLVNVSLPDSVEIIDERCFAHCTSLKRINFPPNIKHISASCFFGCRALEEIIIPSGVVEIGEESFAGCTSLKRIDIPTSVEKIGKCCFSVCTSLEKINVPGNVREIGEGCFAYCTSLTHVVLNSHCITLGPGCFRNCDALARESLPDAPNLF